MMQRTSSSSQVLEVLDWDPTLKSGVLVRSISRQDEGLQGGKEQLQFLASNLVCSNHNEWTNQNPLPLAVLGKA